MMLKNRIVSFVFALFGTIFYAQAQGNVLFFEEYIDFSIDSNYFSINGIYSFQNTNVRAVNQQIMFPFAEDASKIDSIRIINLYSGKNIDFIRRGNFIHFTVYLPVNDTVDVNIFYRQKTAAENKYIIRSTQSWGKPLQTAVYTLTAEKNIKIKSFSYSPDTVKESDDKILYTWKKYDFMPEYDFEIILDE
jgi:hypothetical protein